MARRDVSQNDSAYSPHLVDALMLAGFLGGFSVFLAFVTFEEPSELTKAPLPVATSAAPVETPQARQANPPAFSLKNVKDLQNRPSPRTMPVSIPEAANPPRLETVVAASLPAAVAQKPKASVVVATEKQLVLAKRPPRTELELEEDLEDLAPTVGLDLAKAEALVRVMRAKPPMVGKNGFQTKPTATVLAMLPHAMEDGLPFSEKANCQLDSAAARYLETYSKHLHKQITQIDNSVKRRFPSTFANRRDEVMAHSLGQDPKCQAPRAVPALMQVLQVESTPVRQEVIELLSDKHTPQSTKALVNRAVFDLSPEVRQEANQALRQRTRRDYRAELLEALRYPWAPAAWHAAETLVAVKDKNAVPNLVELLDAPEPTMPYRDKNNKLVVRELVRLNHAQNCLLCHAPSRDDKDPVRGFVPVPRSRAYYADRTSGVLVRADVTYLRQDFSVMHDMDKSNAGRNLQRFDYLVRTREATEKEQLISYGEGTSPKEVPSYSQREAILFALRKLTGKDLGPRTEDWRRSQQLLVESW